MDVYPSIASFFQRHLEASSLAVDAIADTLGDAIELLAQAILADQKLFSIGLGADRASATALTSLLQHGILRERPSLPVVELATHQVETSELGVGWVSQQLQALGQAGDVGVVFSATLQDSEIQRLALTAEQRRVSLIWIGNRGPGISVNLAQESIETTLAVNHTLAVCLAHLIDTHTFGPLEA